MNEPTICGVLFGDQPCVLELNHSTAHQTAGGEWFWEIVQLNKCPGPVEAIVNIPSVFPLKAIQIEEILRERALQLKGEKIRWTSAPGPPPWERE